MAAIKLSEIAQMKTATLSIEPLKQVFGKKKIERSVLATSITHKAEANRSAKLEKEILRER
jgi:hypothetical protein